MQIPFNLVARLWDTYLAEGDGFAEFLVYACASFLLTVSADAKSFCDENPLQPPDKAFSVLQWSDQLKVMDFQGMILFLQNVPTERWTQQELEMVLSRAFMWRVLFNRSPKHLGS